MWDRTSALPICAGGMTDVDIFRNALNVKTHTHKAPLAVPRKALPGQDGARDSVWGPRRLMATMISDFFEGFGSESRSRPLDDLRSDS